MKKLLALLLLVNVSSLFAQTFTDTIATPIGDFSLVTNEEGEVSSAFSDETTVTSDGGTVEFVGVTSGARFADEQTILGEGIAMKLAPNPASNVVEVQLTGITGAVTLTAINVLGQIVYSANLNVESGRPLYIPAQQWGSGNYLIMINAGSQVLQEKLVVK